MEAKLKVLMVDDHALFRDGMRYVLQQLPEECEITEANNYHDGLEIAMAHPELDLALLDLNMQGSDGPISIKHFHHTCPQIPVVVVSGEEGRDIVEAVINFGAMGFVCKSSSSETMLGALQLVLSGGIYIPQQVLATSIPLSVTATSAVYKEKRSRHLNQFGLTQRQMLVLQHLALGMSNKEISDAINLAEGTVKVHVAALYQALHVNSRMEAVQLAKQLGLIGDQLHV